MAAFFETQFKFALSAPEVADVVALVLVLLQLSDNQIERVLRPSFYLETITMMILTKTMSKNGLTYIVKQPWVFK